MTFQFDWVQLIIGIIAFFAGVGAKHYLEKVRYNFRIKENLQLKKLGNIQEILEAYSNAFYLIRNLVHHRKNPKMSDEDFHIKVIEIRDAIAIISKIILEKRHFIEATLMKDFDAVWIYLLWMQGAFKDNKENSDDFVAKDDAVNKGLLKVSQYLSDKYKLYQ
jgi:hypothetical protein